MPAHPQVNFKNIFITRILCSSFSRITKKNPNEKFNKLNAAGDRRDIGALSVNRPKSIERILNKDEVHERRCFEIIGGSPLTEEELNATKKSQINTVCPESANPNYVPY